MFVEQARPVDTCKSVCEIARTWNQDGRALHLSLLQQGSLRVRVTCNGSNVYEWYPLKLWTS